MKSALLGFLDAVKRYRGRFLAVACAMFAVAMAALAALALVRQSVAPALLLLGIAMMCALGINTLLVSVLPMYFVPLGRTSTITGLLNTCMHFASSVSSYAIAAMSAAWGWPPTVLGWAGMSLIGAVCTLAVRGRFYGFVRRLEPETKK